MPFIRNQNREEFKERHELAMLCTQLKITEKTYIALSAYHLGGLEMFKCESFREEYKTAKEEVWKLSNDKINQLQHFFHKLGRSL